MAKIRENVQLETTENRPRSLSYILVLEKLRLFLVSSSFQTTVIDLRTYVLRHFSLRFFNAENKSRNQVIILQKICSITSTTKNDIWIVTVVQGTKILFVDPEKEI